MINFDYTIKAINTSMENKKVTKVKESMNYEFKNECISMLLCYKLHNNVCIRIITTKLFNPFTKLFKNSESLQMTKLTSIQNVIICLNFIMINSDNYEICMDLYFQHEQTSL